VTISRQRLIAGALPLLTLCLAIVVSGCRPAYPKCDNDEHCAEKREFCVNGLCQQCRDTSNCGTCQQCTGGQCTAVPGCCQTDTDCAMAQRCRGGQCGAECLDDTECDGGNRCSAGRCTPPAECAGDGDCPGGQACEAGRCVQPAAQSCSIERIQFDFDRYEIRSDARSTLDANAECLRSKGSPSLTIEGHCDDHGTEEYNLALGERRARAAKRYLERLGISGIRVVSYGENRPLSRSGGAGENRRAEFVTN
jgi:peptidoglycan-associated lipoprotein